MVYNNPNTFTGLVEGAKKTKQNKTKQNKQTKQNKKTYLPKKGGRVGGEKKKPRTQRAHGCRGSGLKPGTCRVLGEGPQLHAMGVV